MRHLTITKQLFWFISFFVIFATFIITLYIYNQTLATIETRAYSRAKSLEAYFKSMRYVYHQQFLKSGIDLNDSTVGFLPAHAASFISDHFAKRSPDGTTIRNVTDRPRNPTNQADSFELDAIQYFKQNPTKTERFTAIKHNEKNYFFYSAPLKIEPYCIQCHGSPNEVLPYISKRYKTALDYKVGDIRGITSIKVPVDTISEHSIKTFWKEALLNLIIIFFLLTIIYITIRQLTRKDVKIKQFLEKEVRKRTADLEETTFQLAEANRYQKHLFSILRTVADSNQILITTSSLDELIDKTARCLAENPSFAFVKISLEENNELKVKSAYGLDDSWNILPIEQTVLKANTASVITSTTTNLSTQCKMRIDTFKITGIYISPLRKDNFATQAFGTMTICTTQINGFTIEERSMIDELAGDLGFAINSFFQQEDILKLSYYDSLTDLPNRRLFSERFIQAMHNSERSQQYGGLLFIDVDNFKGVNDLKGHVAGDMVLKEMAERLRTSLRQVDTIARFGGDEFVILIENLSKNYNEAAESIQTTTHKILEFAKEPFIIENQPFYLSVSIGIVLFLENHLTMDQLFSYADSAMYAAKNSGRNTARFYDSELQETMNAQTQLVNDLQKALIEHHFILLYQAQVDNNGTILGLEALIRWNDPHKGVISPNIFIPIAESSGLIIGIGEWVLHQTMKQIALWKHDPIKNQWRISINISPKQFEEETFITHLKELIETYQIPPTRIRLEITEGILIQDAQKAMEKILHLKEIGFSLSIDDFGTGYSSLGYLKNLPIDELKIDQSFIKSLFETSSDKTIVQTIITIGKTFGLEVIAEGVETQAQFEILKSMGCNMFQGYLFSHPEKAEYY